MSEKMRTSLEIFIQLVIFYSLAMYFVELEFTNTENSHAAPKYFLWSERIVASIFTIEYFVRWGKAKNKLRYPFTALAIIDLLAILPFYIGFLVDLRVLRIIRTLRVLRLFKFYRYNEALRSFVVSFERVRHELYIIGVAILCLVFFSSTLEYEFERNAQPQMFARYSDAVWWSVITLTTVGYGDKYPITIGGRLVAVGTLVIGLGIFGTFLSLIGSAFMETLQSKTRIFLSESARQNLIDLQKQRDLPDDDLSLQDLAGDIIAQHKSNVVVLDELTT